MRPFPCTDPPVNLTLHITLTEIFECLLHGAATHSQPGGSSPLSSTLAAVCACTTKMESRIVPPESYVQHQSKPPFQCPGLSFSLSGQISSTPEALPLGRFWTTSETSTRDIGGELSSAASSTVVVQILCPLWQVSALQWCCFTEIHDLLSVWILSLMDSGRRVGVYHVSLINVYHIYTFSISSRLKYGCFSFWEIFWPPLYASIAVFCFQTVHGCCHRGSWLPLIQLACRLHHRLLPSTKYNLITLNTTNSGSLK